MNKVLYIDIETSKLGRIKDVGALFNGQELHESQLTKLENWIIQSEYICGHNIVAHDIPLLERVLGNEIFRNKKIVDTLLWSPLLFSDNPYHKLVKGYKIVNDLDDFEFIRLFVLKINSKEKGYTLCKVHTLLFVENSIIFLRKASFF